MYCDDKTGRSVSVSTRILLCDLAFRPVLRVRPGIKGWMKLYFERSEISLPTSWTRNKPIEELITTCDEAQVFTELLLTTAIICSTVDIVAHHVPDGVLQIFHRR